MEEFIKKLNIKPITQIYASSNCNQKPAVVDWGLNNLICYASNNAVFIWDPNFGAGGCVIHTLYAHKGPVNAVKWIPCRKYETEIVSGSSDQTVIVWTFNEKNNTHTHQILKGHTGNVNIVEGSYNYEKIGSAFVFSASDDCSIRIWCRPKFSENFRPFQTIDLNYNLATALAFAYIVLCSSNVLALSCDDCNIKLFLKPMQLLEIKDDKFKEICSIKAHSDWICGLSFLDELEHEPLLASCSQDTTIKLWRIHSNRDSKQPQLKPTLESVLSGHEGSVYSVRWNHLSIDFQYSQLISASMDKTMIIWEFDTEVSLWQEKVRVGEVGGNTLGFFGGMFSGDNKRILGHSYTGAFHMWKIDENGTSWTPEVTVGGHFRGVTDLQWDRLGEFIITTSADQTTRIHAPWPREEEDAYAEYWERAKVTWHEIARPQVHGYDLSSVALISRYKFASGAEEKVIRAFRAPKNFIDNFRRLCRIEDEYDRETYASEYPEGTPEGASVPSLGLSNKAVFCNTNNDDSNGDRNVDQRSEDSYFTAVELTEPPTEETLIQNTLWPEEKKLYGHGYEIMCLAVPSTEHILASASKATNIEHAAIIIWETSSWTQIQKLQSHTLTVVQLAFSPNLKLLSVSRDRRWSVFNPLLNGTYKLAGTVDKKLSIHTRIIWCCAWSHDSEFFTTGSRDGKVVFWEEIGDDGITGGWQSVFCVDKKGESVTALAFAPKFIGCQIYLLAVGLESGEIALYGWNSEKCELLQVFDRDVGHQSVVKKLAFRPVFGQAGYKKDLKNILQLASCSDDTSVKVFDINVKESVLFPEEDEPTYEADTP